MKGEVLVFEKSIHLVIELCIYEEKPSRECLLD
jgi:hypothetical protein